MQKILAKEYSKILEDMDVIKWYRYEFSYGKGRLYEEDNNLQVLSEYTNDNNYKWDIRNSIFAIDGHTDIFNRTYLANDNVLQNLYAEAMNVSGYFDNKPIIICRNDDKYAIEKMNKEQFWNNRKILVIKNAEKDCKALFKDIKAIFHTDITLPIKEGSIARYYANPLSIKIYYNNDLEFDIRVDKYYHLDVLIIKDKRCVDSAYQTTIIYRDRSREILYEPQVYTYIKGCKGTFNPLLNKKIVEINEIPIVISYNEDDMVSSYEGESTITKLDDYTIASKYLAFLKNNRDWIFKDNIWYVDGLYRENGSYIFTRYLCRKVK